MRYTKCSKLENHHFIAWFYHHFQQYFYHLFIWAMASIAMLNNQRVQVICCLLGAFASGCHFCGFVEGAQYVHTFDPLSLAFPGRPYVLLFCSLLRNLQVSVSSVSGRSSTAWRVGHWFLHEFTCMSTSQYQNPSNSVFYQGFSEGVRDLPRPKYQGIAFSPWILVSWAGMPLGCWCCPECRPLVVVVVCCCCCCCCCCCNT